MLGIMVPGEGRALPLWAQYEDVGHCGLKPGRRIPARDDCHPGYGATRFDFVQGWTVDLYDLRAIAPRIQTEESHWSLYGKFSSVYMQRSRGGVDTHGSMTSGMPIRQLIVNLGWSVKFLPTLGKLTMVGMPKLVSSSGSPIPESIRS